MVNAYMKNMLHVWQANHDIQFVLDAYSCIVYICDYLTKAHKGMSNLLSAACEEAKKNNLGLKQSVRHMGNKFLNAVEISEQEACFNLLELPITKSNIAVQFIPTAPQDERVFIAKKDDDLRALHPDSDDVKMSNIIDHYSRRPRILQNWCLADYVSLLTLQNEKKKNPQDIESDNDDCDNYISHDNNDSVNLIGENTVSDDNDSDLETEDSPSEIFPMYLRNGKILTRRKKRKVLRFVNYKEKVDPENYYRERLLLYVPWRKESTDLFHGQASYHDAFKLKTPQIVQMMQIYEPMSHILEEAMLLLEQEQQMENCETAPSTQHEDIVHQNMPTEDSITFQMFDPDRPLDHRIVDIGPQLGIPTSQFCDSVTMVENIMDDNNYRLHMRSLNREQYEFFTHVLHCAILGSTQHLSCLHGGAGTGKSHVLKAIYQSLYRLLSSTAGVDNTDKRILIVSPTGKAAYNVNGSTINSAFHVPANQPLYNYMPLSYDNINSYRAKYRNLRWILCDEISMVSNYMLRYIHLRMQDIMANKLPFGGVNVIAIGDLYQLKPVKGSYIFKDLGGDYGPLATNLWTEHFKIYELHEIMRQKGDQSFAELLNRLRLGKHTANDIATLKSRLVKEEDTTQLSHLPRFFPMRAQVQAYNEQALQHLPENSTVVTVTAIDITPSDLSHKFRDKIIRVTDRKLPKDTGGLPKKITIATQAQYDLISNIDVEDGLMNGAECCVKHIYFEPGNTAYPAIVWVKFEDPRIGRDHRRNYKHLYTRDIVSAWTPVFAIKRSFKIEDVFVHRIQFPLRQAAARTIHVAQSATFKEILVDMRGNARTPKIFWDHMHYVAFSRVTSLAGLHITNLNEDNIRTSSHVEQYLQEARQRNNLQLSFTPMYNFSDSHFKIAYNNCRSYRKHYKDVQHDFTMLAADIIALSETKLTTYDPTERFDLHDFIIYRMDQSHPSMPHHGLLLHVRKTIKIISINFHPGNNFEAISIVTDYRKFICQIIFIYSSPRTTNAQLLHELQRIIPQKCQLPIFLIGDFNVHTSSNTSNFLTSFLKRKYNLDQFISTPTTTYLSTIDLVFSNYHHHTCYALANYWSDHFTLCAAIETDLDNNSH